MIVFIYSICREILFPCRPSHGCIQRINAPVSLSCLQFTQLRGAANSFAVFGSWSPDRAGWAPAPFLERWTWPFCFSPNGSKLSIISCCFCLFCVDQTQMCSVSHFPHLQTARSCGFFSPPSQKMGIICFWGHACGKLIVNIKFFHPFLWRALPPAYSGKKPKILQVNPLRRHLLLSPWKSTQT